MPFNTTFFNVLINDIILHLKIQEGISGILNSLMSQIFIDHPFCTLGPGNTVVTNANTLTAYNLPQSQRCRQYNSKLSDGLLWE